MKIVNFKKNRGITIVETLMYSVILVVVLVVILQSMISIIKSHRLVKLKQSVEASAVISMERILRETRNATSIDLVNSILGSSPGKIVLNGVDENDTAYTREFMLVGESLLISKDAAPPGPLSVPGVTVDSLIFRNVSNDVSDGIKVEMSLTGTSGTETKNLDLFGFAILRNSY